MSTNDVVDYHLNQLEVIGRGVFTNVYAYDYQLAIKSYPLADETKWLGMLSEIYILHNIRHAHIISLQKIIYNDHDKSIDLFIPRALCNLHDYLCHHTLSSRQICNWGYQLANALACVNIYDLAHGDIKCSNILISPQRDAVCLADWNISQRIVNCHYDSNMQLYTLWYRAPELLYQIQGISQASEVWAYGCVLLEMLNGGPLFIAQTEDEQIKEIANFLGWPSRHNWPEFYMHMKTAHYAAKADKFIISGGFAYHRKNIYLHQRGCAVANIANSLPYERIFTRLQHMPKLYNLLLQIFQYDPQRRPTLQMIQQHPYFHDRTQPSLPIIGNNTLADKLLLLSAKVSTSQIPTRMQLSPEYPMIVRAWLYELARNLKLPMFIPLRTVYLYNMCINFREPKKRYLQLVILVCFYVITNLDYHRFTIYDCLRYCENMYDYPKFVLMFKQYLFILADNLFFTTAYDFILNSKHQFWSNTRQLNRNNMQVENLLLPLRVLSLISVCTDINSIPASDMATICLEISRRRITGRIGYRNPLVSDLINIIRKCDSTIYLQLFATHQILDNFCLKEIYSIIQWYENNQQIKKFTIMANSYSHARFTKLTKRLFGQVLSDNQKIMVIKRYNKVMISNCQISADDTTFAPNSQQSHLNSRHKGINQMELPYFYKLLALALYGKMQIEIY